MEEKKNPPLFCRFLFVLAGLLSSEAGLLANDVTLFYETEKLVLDNPRQAFTTSEQQITILKVSDPNRAKWYAIASEAAFTLSFSDIAIRYAADGLGHQNLDSALVLRLNIALANAFTQSGRPTDALARLDNYKSLPTSSQYYVDYLLGKARAHTAINQYQLAVSDLLNAYDHAQASGDGLVKADVALALGKAYFSLRDPVRALRLLTEAARYFDEQKRQLSLSRALYLLGETELSETRIDLAEQHFERAYLISEAINDSQGKANADYGRGLIALKKKNFLIASQRLAAAKMMFERGFDVIALTGIEIAMAEISRHQLQFNESLDHLKKAEKHAGKAGDSRLLISIFQSRARVYSDQSQFQSAYLNLLDAEILEEKLVVEEKNRTLAELRVQFDADQQEQKNLLLEKQAALNQAKLDEQARRSQLLIAISMSMILIVLFLGFTWNRSRKMQQRLERLSMTDELTQLPNRRAIIHMLEAEIGRSHRDHKPISIAVVDLDHFKSINDQFGHDAGDDVLKRFATMALSTLRKYDGIGRYGGEEFLVVLPSANIDTATDVCNRLVLATSKLHSPLLKGKHQPTTSIGVAEYDREKMDVDQLLKRADEAVYEAKRRGRNRVVSQGKVES